MSNILFVCYRHGCRGEFLTHKISQQSIFRKLEAKVVDNRTVITNDFFNKEFLKSYYPKIKKFPKENVVVPSHYFYEDLVDDFPTASFVAIDLPKDVGTFRESLYQRFWNYSTSDRLELLGEIKDKYYKYNGQKNKNHNELKKIIYNILKIKNITFGDIACLVQKIEPTEENKKKLFEMWTLRPLSTLTKEKSLVIPFEEVSTFPLSTIVNYFKKCKGSL